MTSPFILITAAMISGILAVEYLESWWAPAITAMLGIAIYFYFIHKGRSLVGTLQTVNKHWIWIALLFFSIGMSTTLIHRPAKYDFENDIYPQWATGTVKETHQRAKSTEMTVALDAFFDEDTIQHVANTKVIVWSEAVSYSPGSRVVFVHHLRPITNSGNALNENYAQYMRHHGILYSQSINDADIRKVGEVHDLNNFVNSCRDWCVTQIEKSRLDTPTSDFVMAILLGYRDNLTPDTKSSFQQSGLSHIMALSGLHIGIIAGILSILFFPLNILGKWRWRHLLVIISLWCYTILTGMAPSALRATIMATFLFGGLILERRSSMVNALFAAAFFILLFTPGAIYEAGFLLSFSAALIISLCIQRVNPINRHDHPQSYKLFSIVAVSLIAMIGTMGLVVYYFHILPVASLPFNIILAILFPIYLTIGFFYALFLFIGIDLGFVAKILELGYQWLVQGADTINSLAVANIRVYIPGISVWGIYLTIVAVILRLYYKQRVYSYAALLFGVATVCCIALLPSGRPDDGFIVQRSSAPTIRIYDNGYEEMLALPAASIKLYSIDNKLVLWIDKNVDTTLSTPCDVAVIGKGCNSSLTDIAKAFPAKCYVGTQSIYSRHSEQLAEEANSLQLHYHSIRDDGPYKMFD
jgi:competence protein ComEC